MRLSNCNFRIKALPAFLATLLLTACGVPATPSESNVKDQMKSLFSQCDSVSIADLKKINGIPQQDGSYIVRAEFTLRISPQPDNEKLIGKMKARHVELEPRFKETWAQRQSLFDERGSLDATVRNAEYRPGADQDPDLARQKARLAELEQKFRDLEVKNQDLWGEYLNYDRYFAAPGTNIELANNFLKTCKVKTNGLGGNILLQVFNDAKAYGEKLEPKMTADISMIKTDKGWMMAELTR